MLVIVRVVALAGRGVDEPAVADAAEGPGESREITGERDARRGLPLVAMLGAVTVLVCDIVGRSLPGLFTDGAPGAGEIPVGTIVGVLGGAVFLAMMLKGVRNG